MESKRIKDVFLTVAVFVAVLTAVLTATVIISAISPTGGSITPGTPERAPNDTAGSDNAFAGNVTELTITGYPTTQSWQGYYGNVSGAIQLADSGDNVLYNWSLADPEGEVYASTNSSISWANVQCFNYTANQSYGDESGNGGTTNLAGLNLSGLETRFNITWDDPDGVNETFTLSGAGTHDLFYTANQQFSEGECLNTRVFGDTGVGVSDEFEEVLLYEPTTASVIFASLLESGSVLGFDTGDYDFEMLVLEDGHNSDTSTTAYYFFVELE